jgi:hypothetical protein
VAIQLAVSPRAKTAYPLNEKLSKEINDHFRTLRLAGIVWPEIWDICCENNLR